MEFKRIFTIKNEEETRAFGLELGKNARAGQVIGLIGDLGTGKTALAGYIAEGLGITETISSPTFNIIKEYNSGRLPFYHFDVYRLTDPENSLTQEPKNILTETGCVWWNGPIWLSASCRKIPCLSVLNTEKQKERGYTDVHFSH